MNNANSKPAQLVLHASVAELVEIYGEPSSEAIKADQANLEAIVQWVEDESDIGGVIEP